MSDRTRLGNLHETSRPAAGNGLRRGRMAGEPARAVFRVTHRLYKIFLSPLLGNRCRFYPSCSDYALEAVERYGALKGGWLAIGRVCRCHPLTPGGLDPVEARGEKTHG